MNWLKLVGDVAFAASALAAVVFVVLYATRSAWRQTAAGRVTLGFMSTVAAIMVNAMLFGTIWRTGHETERLLIRAALYALLLGGIVHYIVILLRAQRRERQQKALRGS